MTKVRKARKGKKRSAAKLPVPRNPIAQNPLMKKSHAHTLPTQKGSKADRAKAKLAIKRGYEDV